MLNKTSTLLAIGVAMFALYWLIMFLAMSSQESYRLVGKWTTMPDFESQINRQDSELSRVYSRLNGWDGQWYYHIAANGYACEELPKSNNPFICNIAFFPLVPALGKLLSDTGIGLNFALPLVSQLLWLSSIVIFLLLLRSISGVSAGQLVILSLLVTYPGAMYFSTAYSEPTLSFLLLAIVALSHWHLQAPGWGKILALCIACYLLGLVKVTGILGLSLPFLMAMFHLIQNGKSAKRASAMLLIPCLAGVLGLASFLAYLYFAFGDWALYFRYVSGGWNYHIANTVNVNPLVIFTSFTWPGYLPLNISNLLMLLCAPVLMLAGWPVIRQPKKFPVAAPALLITAFIFYFFYAVVGHTSESIHGDFMRHLLPVIALLVLALGIIYGRIDNGKIKRYLIASFGLLAITSLYMQHKLYQLFAAGLWVS